MTPLLRHFEYEGRPMQEHYRTEHAIVISKSHQPGSAKTFSLPRPTNVILCDQRVVKCLTALLTPSPLPLASIESTV
jgi:hypothetical protein